MYLRSTGMGVLGSGFLNPARLGATAAAERDLAGGAGIEHPVRRAIAADQPTFAAHADHVDRGRVWPSRLPPSHREDVAVWGGPTQLGGDAGPPVDQPGARG